MSNIKYTGFHHLAFVTHDMESTIRFWRDLLGMRLVYTQGRPGYRQYFFQVAGDDLISFFEWPDAEKVPYRRHGDRPETPRDFDHISIGVPDEESLWRIVALLSEAGFPVSDVIDHGFIRSIYGYDPNHIPIEFSCTMPGQHIIDCPVMKDSDPGPAAREGSEPMPGHWPEAPEISDDEKEVIIGEGACHFP